MHVFTLLVLYSAHVSSPPDYLDFFLVCLFTTCIELIVALCIELRIHV